MTTYSIITINYNNKAGLQETIKSVLEQTDNDYEFIVIDGNSDDGSKEAILNHTDNIDYWVSEPDSGIYNAMNKGIRKANGEYLVFLNSGDTFYNSDVLKDVKPTLGCDVIVGKIYKTKTRSYGFLPTSSPTMMLFYEGSLDHQACFIKRELFQDTLYDESLRISADWKFFIQKIVFENRSISKSPVVISSYEGGGISENPKYSALHKAEREKVLKEMLPPRILADYQRYVRKESPMLDLIPQFNRTHRLNAFILWVVRTILKTYHFFKPSRL